MGTSVVRQCRWSMRFLSRLLSCWAWGWAAQRRKLQHTRARCPPLRALAHFPNGCPTIARCDTFQSTAFTQVSLAASHVITPVKRIRDLQGCVHASVFVLRCGCATPCMLSFISRCIAPIKSHELCSVISSLHDRAYTSTSLLICTCTGHSHIESSLECGPICARHSTMMQLQSKSVTRSLDTLHVPSQRHLLQ